MTPKEKADELIKKMNVIHYLKLGGKNKDSKGLPVSMHKSQVKQCSLKAIEEIVTEIGQSADKEFLVNRLAYYDEVKAEVLKM
jgi:hypothetical protein